MSEDREVIRCPHCKLNQFMTVKGNCRRCYKRLKAQVVVAPEPITLLTYGERLRYTRKALGLPRRIPTLSNGFQSRLELNKANWTLVSLEKVCEALQMTPREFLHGHWEYRLDDFSKALLQARRELPCEDFKTILDVLKSM